MKSSVALPRFALAIVMTMAGFFLSGCAATRATPNGSASNQGVLSVNSSSLNFGSVLVGSTSSLSVVLTNSSTVSADITISGLTVSGSTFTLAGPSLPLVLTPGQQTRVNVTFGPKAGGNASGILVIVSDASNANVSVPLSGVGVTSAQLSVTPTAMNFGNIALGKSQVLNGKLSASGAAITVSSASWNGSGYSVSGISFPTTVGNGQQLAFNVSFAPQAAGAAAGKISFINNGTPSPLTVQLSGTGVQTTQHSVALSWGPSTSAIQGYYVYRGGVSGGPYSRLSSLQTGLSYTDVNVISGQTYYYVVTSLGIDNVESSYSNQAVAQIP